MRFSGIDIWVDPKSEAFVDKQLVWIEIANNSLERMLFLACHLLKVS